MKNIIAIIAVAFAFAGSAIANTATVDQLVAKLPEQYTKNLRTTAVVNEARTNQEFYDSLKAKGFVIDDVQLSRAHVVSLAFARGDYEQFDTREAAKFLPLVQYKSYVAAKVQSLGGTVAVYDWIQQQRLVVVEAGPNDAAAKNEFLIVIADQVIASEKAKP